jgi:hypothetical protein
MENDAKCNASVHAQVMICFGIHDETVQNEAAIAKSCRATIELRQE